MPIGFTEVLLILVVVLLLFGGKRIPELAKAFGRASFEYKKAKEILKKEAQEFSDAVDGCVEKEEAKNNAEKN